jgi:high-affinity Fe2+/Pb2+ permease
VAAIFLGYLVFVGSMKINLKKFFNSTLSHLKNTA